MSGSEGHTHSAQDVRRLQRAGRAGGAAAGADAEFIEHKQNRFTLDVFEADIAGIWKAVFLVAVQAAAGALL